MSAYPSWLVLGLKHENVVRFSGFAEPAEFCAELKDGLHRWQLYRAGKDWDEPTPRPVVPFDDGEVSSLPAPDDAVPAGMVRLGDELFVAQGDTIHAVDPATGKVKRSFAAPKMTQDLASDGEHLYVLPAEWSLGKPIAVLDPKDGRRIREITTPADEGNRSSDARGLAWLAGKLYVLRIMGQLAVVDPATGKIERRLDVGRPWLFGLASDGKQLATVSTQKVLLLLDPGTGKVVREVPSHYALRAVGRDGGDWLVMEQPQWGFDRHHRRIQIWPRETLLWRLHLDDHDGG